MFTPEDNLSYDPDASLYASKAAGRALGTVMEEAAAMSDPVIATTTPPVPGAGFGPVLEMLAESAAIADRHGFSDPALRAAYHAHVLMILSAAYIEVFGTDLASPDWVPYIPYYLARAAPNPDTVYAYAPVVPEGVYRISGRKGTETIAAITLRKGGAHLGVRSGARVGEIDLAAVTADEAGQFSFLLSRTRPPGYSGQWFELQPEANCLMLRRVTKDASQVDGVCGIERLDQPRASVALRNEEIAARIVNVARYTASHNEFVLGYMSRLRKLGAERTFVLDDQSSAGGLIQQSHYFHQFSLEPDEALLLETNLPSVVKYWSIQVITPFASTIDHVLHQSALNDAQARVDSDGRMRCVLSLEDPGVPNWLDPAGWRQGGVQWRWNEVDVAPHPMITKLKLKDLRLSLPADTPQVSPQDRLESLATRASYYQCRRR